ncbi:MAG: hypothetical protein HUK22_01765, partial [Thermoguttaceae bacterium]|nr:hypothetical protein [Thermoguttaceae bacterium]
MSLFIQKRAIETGLTSKKRRKARRRSAAEASSRRVCRIEVLENREYLSADPIFIGVVYEETGDVGQPDIFSVAWVGGESGEGTTLDELVIDLNKNQNYDAAGLPKLDAGECVFDTSETSPGAKGEGTIQSWHPFKFDAEGSSPDIVVLDAQVDESGMILRITLDNFHSGDVFKFTIDVDEFKNDQNETGEFNDTADGSELGGSTIHGRKSRGSYVTATFNSDSYQTTTQTWTFFDEFDNILEYPTAEWSHSATSARPDVLAAAFNVIELPTDALINSGEWGAGVYASVTLTPKPVVISGYVYGDTSLDCYYQVDEDVPLVGATVKLYDADHNYLASTTTDEFGYYEFNDASVPTKFMEPDVYYVECQSGYQAEHQSYYDFCARGGEYGERQYDEKGHIDPNNLKVNAVVPGISAPNNNFAKALPSSVSGYVFEDLNNANNKEFGEGWDGVEFPAKVELWRVNADGTQTFVASQIVDADGYYCFDLDGSWVEESGQ